MIWVASSVVAISWAAVGIYTGLATQNPARQSAAGFCEYRVELVRDRLINLLEQAPGQISTPAGAKFSNLLRETRALCAGRDPETTRKLGRIEALYGDFDLRSSRHADARQELLAL
ncbi:hypothetical protein [Nannocystis sp.]|uniref:hypothetical protein n=1 Tax=Nannocystis sp. TaxID=1962667 RepID=UPI0025E8821C|nr:hypothetical protein [Nannocystis sp.]MBK7824182.1 hypothetical protein [Nannocystis sp.]